MHRELAGGPRRWAAACLTAIVFTGCATVGSSSNRTEMQLTDGAAFARARTFTIKTEDNPITSSSADQDARIRDAIERRIRSILEGKGYQYAGSAADLLVSYHGIALRRQTDTGNIPVPAAYTPVGPGDPFAAYESTAGAGAESGTETVGMLLILVVDGKTDAPVWQGTTEGTGTSPKSAVGAAERATERLLHDVPKSAP